VPERVHPGDVGVEVAQLRTAARARLQPADLRADSRLGLRARRELPARERDAERVVPRRVDAREAARVPRELHQQAAVLGGRPPGAVEEVRLRPREHVWNVPCVPADRHTAAGALDPHRFLGTSPQLLRLEQPPDVCGRDAVELRRQRVVERDLVARVAVEVDAAVLARR
jgi:hypothetical protein